MGDIPARVRGKPQQEHEPPKREDGAHPEFVTRDAHAFRQKARACGKQDVQSREFREASESGMGGCPGKVRPREFGRDSDRKSVV